MIPDRDDSPDTRTAAAGRGGARLGQDRKGGLTACAHPLKGRPRIERRQDQDEAGEGQEDDEEKKSPDDKRRENRPAGRGPWPRA